jgi:hypothetical protein
MSKSRIEQAFEKWSDTFPSYIVVVGEPLRGDVATERLMTFDQFKSALAELGLIDSDDPRDVKRILLINFLRLLSPSDQKAFTIDLVERCKLLPSDEELDIQYPSTYAQITTKEGDVLNQDYLDEHDINFFENYSKKEAIKHLRSALLQDNQTDGI